MENMRVMRLQPTMRMIWEEMTDAGFDCILDGQIQERNYRCVRPYSPTAPLQRDVIYILDREAVSAFPTDVYAFVCDCPVSGGAEHISCQEGQLRAVLETLLDLFSRLQQMEMELDDLVFRGTSLDALCEVGAKMLGNPICIHDDWFVMIARSSRLPEVLPPDTILSSSREFVPHLIVDDFKFDSDYRETYTYKTTQLWSASPDAPPCLYVNLWAGSVYCGRLLVVKMHRDFRELDYLIAQVLTQRVMTVLRRTLPGEDRPLRSMDDVVYELLTQGHSESQDVNRLTEMLGWNKQDELLCIRIKSQQPDVTVTMEHLLHSDLFRAFPGSYILLTEHQQCVIMNVTGEPVDYPELRHRLAPMCRDYCLYAGISSPVRGLRELHLAYHQADVALNRAFRLQNDRWIIPFSDCGLDYLLNHMEAPLLLNHLVSPELKKLISHDREKGTQYFDTLRTYLIQERDIPRTSEALIIHRTTLLYRLKKIRSLTGLELEDANVRLYLLLSLRILEKEMQ